MVFINTLTDGEYGAIETKYYVKDTVIYKVLRMTASFKSPEEWGKYYKRHTANLSCDNCHNKRQCDKTTIYLIPPFSIVSIVKGKQLSLKPEEKLLDLFNTSQAFKSLRTLLSKT
ncbi:MAG: hypothetical protein K0S53_2659 [Bacteroidetes bacterium]|nr:hypothetical protein [Bacteroidota bacterium]